MLDSSLMDFLNLYDHCLLCPRACGVNRSSGSSKGFCRESARLRVAYVGPHFGEEPPLTGTRGSGTIFFTGCSLRCAFCQNYQISRDGVGEATGLEALLSRVETMILRDQVHNINFVTPDHFFPHVFLLVSELRKRGHTLPMVFNLSGYQSQGALDLAEPFADIYLPDFKYASRDLAGKLSNCRDYPDVALSAIGKMVARKGYLDALETEGAIASRGVLVRHLILPGLVDNSLDALTALFLEFGRRLPLSIMSQYCPVVPLEDETLNRPLSRDEFDRVYSHALALGFEHLFIQVPEEGDPSQERSFVPDFRLAQPFPPSNPID